MQEHDCIRQDICLQLNDQISYEQIDKWEKESIAKIQVAAEKARADLRQIVKRSNQQLSTVCQDIAIKLRAARENENFSEIDLNRWMEQLNELKLQVKSQATIYIQEDSSSIVQFIRIRQGNIGNTSTRSKDLLPSKALLSSRIEERFAEVSGLGTMDDGGYCVKHADNDLKFVYFRGEQLYSKGRRVVKFKIEQGTGSYIFFIGICTSDIGLRQIIYHLVVVAGWLSNGEVWLHGKCNTNLKMGAHRSDDIKINDIFQLTLDCDKKQIELFQERIHKTQVIHIDPTKAPLPWRILLALRRQGDSVRILPNS